MQLLQVLFLVFFIVHKGTQFSINVFLGRKRRSRREGRRGRRGGGRGGEEKKGKRRGEKGRKKCKIGQKELQLTKK